MASLGEYQDVEKAPEAFRTISEVADDLGVPQHVLRFWETRFPQIKPMKRGGGRRYYRPDDVDLLRGIRHLLYGEGYTIRGVQRLLKDNGLKFVQGVWREDGPALPAAEPSGDADDADEADEVEDGPGDGAADAGDGEGAGAAELLTAPPTARSANPGKRPAGTKPVTDGMTAPADGAGTDETGNGDRADSDAPGAETAGPLSAAAGPSFGYRRSNFQVAPPAEGARVANPRAAMRPASLSLAQRQRLQAALYELGECRRIIEMALRED